MGEPHAGAAAVSDGRESRLGPQMTDPTKLKLVDSHNHIGVPEVREVSSTKLVADTLSMQVTPR